MKTLATGILALLFCLTAASQSINQEIINEGEAPFLLGKIDKSGLITDNYSSWFNKNYNYYQPNRDVIAALSEEINKYTIKVFIGTWCGDSQREVPRFYKILEACNFNDLQLEVIALSNKPDMYKQSPNHEERGLNIHRVPTFIIYNNDREVNRIVEFPVETLEKDLLNIVTKNNYSPQYIIVKKVDEQLKNGRFKASKKNIKMLKPFAKKMSELNTYAHILFTTQREIESIEVSKLNTLLFPEDPKTFENLGHKYYAMNQPKKALKSYQQALKINPDDQNIKSYINALENNP